MELTTKVCAVPQSLKATAIKTSALKYSSELQDLTDSTRDFNYTR